MRTARNGCPFSYKNISKNDNKIIYKQFCLLYYKPLAIVASGEF